ncbi:MAG TPA: ASCH domain-containing protein [Verrucomicrobiae bacterium]|nr:ASCH domain-containing protein [Verrucomicrobiae bacterium]
MPGLNFQKKFAPKILSGEKPFTLRALRTDGRDPKTGERLYMFTDQRSKNCKKIAEKVCGFAVTIQLLYCWVGIPGLIGLARLDLVENFARLDGFDSYEAFCKFHKIRDGMKKRDMRLIAWVSREELAKLLGTQVDRV